MKHPPLRSTNDHPDWGRISGMLTETVAGRTFDYSHNVGRGAQTGMGFNTPVAMTIGA